jgi:hypothetical protein
MEEKCFECEDIANHKHHVIPKIYGGKKTINLCAGCHSKIHSHHLLKTSEMTKAAMQKLKSEGKYTGGKPPYGYSLVDGDLVENEKEQETIRLTLKYKADGLSYRKISKVLAEAGRLSRTSNTFDHRSIKQMGNENHNKNPLSAMSLTRIVANNNC